MCDPVTLGLAIATSVGGAAITGQSNANTAEAQANAANVQLEQNIAQQEAYSKQNEGTFNTNLNNYTPTSQDMLLASAQAARGNTDTSNITQPDTSNDIPSGAPAAVTQDIAKRMGAVMDLANNQAIAKGNLGGYGDDWLQNQLGNASANREMGVINTESQQEANLLSPEQQIAEEGAWSPPSPLGAILSGTGSILGSAAGKGTGGASSFTPQSSNPTQIGSLY